MTKTLDIYIRCHGTILTENKDIIKDIPEGCRVQFYCEAGSELNSQAADAIIMQGLEGTRINPDRMQTVRYTKEGSNPAVFQDLETRLLGNSNSKKCKSETLYDHKLKFEDKHLITGLILIPNNNPAQAYSYVISNNNQAANNDIIRTSCAAMSTDQEKINKLKEKYRHRTKLTRELKTLKDLLNWIGGFYAKNVIIHWTSCRANQSGVRNDVFCPDLGNLDKFYSTAGANRKVQDGLNVKMLEIC